ncbi:phosphate acyltransferase [Neisseria elongata subsp. glycolytica ATCC 29315]|jgi:fatty acid/phospholipid synthesis protein plsX|uniref:Phosphate acyltransferase n=2 Tax=Neisseria elongata subsp. glycolytica ATCC 29315 TaxID=546263 RepID=A0A0B5CFT8_NEIEG|nr:phosphate acyltransferase PlsX [Neisseria elongata]AJE17877.1 phosphate acyltransferase [Neisseria elongata subsp. glycolytica ATCC 29315]SQH49732.1 putative glycerol-3-phosphate acyltransferase PlsX [Neisseria elongata subsp. glycolytica]
MITLAVDAMGGDAGLAVTIPGALLFLRQQADVRLLIVGDEVQVRQALEAANAPMDRIQIVHAAQVVEMDEQPQSALKNKKDSSMRIAVNQVKEGLAQAAVSAGNTGALMATARFVLKTIQGIERPAIAKFIPSQNGHMTLVLDLGANVDCTPEQLVQFAVIGSELVHALYPNAGAPRVGLLNVGTEDIKGTDTVKQVFKLLSGSKLNFVGNVEGGSIFSGDVDVVVADGFVGNIVLKTIEGAVRFMGSAIKQEFQTNLLTKLGALAAMPALKGFKNKLDPRKFNGAIFLGLRGVVIKSHGGTDAVGFSYALEEAFHEAKADSLTRIQQGVADQLAHLADKKLEVEQAAINID